MRAIAFLYQHQRAVQTMEVDGEVIKYIEVILADIAKANKLANEVLGQSLDELAKPSRTLLNSIFQMVKELAQKQNISLDEVFFTRRDVREYTGWTDWQVKAHIKQLEEMEYVYVRMGARGKEYAYALNYQGQAEENPSAKCFLNLTPVEEIVKLINRGSIPTTPGAPSRSQARRIS
jgi:DNA-binding MarR family transcriptional regulator